MPQLQLWDASKTKSELAKRILAAFDANKKYENLWISCERAAYNVDGSGPIRNYSFPPTQYPTASTTEVDSSKSTLGVNHAFKNVRFLHAQMSANPPSVAMRPLTSDAEDRRKAEAAEGLKQYFLRQYELSENVDQVTLSTLTYGTGVAKIFHDASKGEIIDIDDQGVVTLSGDFNIKAINIRNIGIDPDATRPSDIRYIVERQYVPFEEALYYWPEKADLLESVRIQNREGDKRNSYISYMDDEHNDVVEIYEYWETGLPVNGMLGRFAICTQQGDLLEPMRANPHKFAPPAKGGTLADSDGGKKKFEVACLPYEIFTDIDMPYKCHGLAALSYAVGLQDILNNLDSASLDNVYAHSSSKLVLNDGMKLAPGSITNSPWDILITPEGSGPPQFMPPAPLQQAAIALRSLVADGIDQMFGVNESMFGQQSRETSGFSMQYATNQGNMIRRRLFNKYTLLVEHIYKHLFKLAQKHWTVKRTINVLGNEMEMQAISLSGEDIDGGFDIVGEYGTNLSLDPITRRQEILSLAPLMQQASTDPQTSAQEILNKLKLNDVNRPTLRELGEFRQREIYHQMLIRRTYLPPEEWQDHKNMLIYASYFTATKEFYNLLPEEKAWIIQHNKARIAMNAALAAPPATPSPAPGGASAGGLSQVNIPPPPAAPGTTGAPTDVTQGAPVANG